MGACHRQFCARPGFKSRLNQSSFVFVYGYGYLFTLAGFWGKKGGSED